MNTYRCIILILCIIALYAPLAAAAQGAEGSPKVLNNIVYARIGDRALHVNLIMPPDYETKQYPAVIWVHGGGWQGGSYMDDLAGAFKIFGKGFVTGSIEYRLSQEAKYPAQINDCKAAIRFLRANAKKYGIDPNRIGVWGGSAGGHLVALMGTTGGVKQLEGDVGKYVDTSSEVQAVCDLFGPTEFTEATMKEYIPAVQAMIEGLLGGPISEKRGLARLASPINFASKDDPPMLILHGDQDPLVPMNQSDKLYDVLKKAGVDVTLVKVKGASHGFAAVQKSDPSFEEVTKMIQDFFVRTLVEKK